MISLTTKLFSYKINCKTIKDKKFSIIISLAGILFLSKLDTAETQFHIEKGATDTRN